MVIKQGRQGLTLGMSASETPTMHCLVCPKKLLLKPTCLEPSTLSLGCLLIHGQHILGTSSGRYKIYRLKSLVMSSAGLDEEFRKSQPRELPRRPAGNQVGPLVCPLVSSPQTHTEASVDWIQTCWSLPFRLCDGFFWSFSRISLSNTALNSTGPYSQHTHNNRPSPVQISAMAAWGEMPVAGTQSLTCFASTASQTRH